MFKADARSTGSGTGEQVAAIASPGKRASAAGFGEGIGGSSTIAIQAMLADPDGNPVAAATDAEGAVAGASSESGAPLPPDLRGRFEESLGVELGGVSVHTGAASADAAGAVGARAYALGQDIHFAHGEYDPGSAVGQRLIAHEVAHTVQQRGGNPARQAKLEVSGPGDAAEVEADSAADAMISGRFFTLNSSPAAIQRNPVEGGAATQTDLEQDLLRVMDNWLEAARAGVTQFVTADLATRITAIESGSWRNFLQTLVGGTIWCASAFASGGAAFAIGMVGMGIQALTALPSQSAEPDALATIQELFHRYIEAGHAHGSSQAAGVASRIIAANANITRYRAIGLALQNSFRANLITVPADYATIPHINSTAVRQLYRDTGADMLSRFRTQINPIGNVHDIFFSQGGNGSTTTTVVSVDGRLAQVDRRDMMIPGMSRTSYRFLMWISDDLRESALRALGGTAPTVARDQITDIP